MFSQDIGKPISVSEPNSLKYGFFLDNTVHLPHFGQFQMRRFLISTDSRYARENQSGNIDILALGQAEERFKKAHIRQGDFSSRQLQQIKSRVEIFYGQRSFLDRTDNNLNPYGKMTPDGGIRNAVYEDIRQPEINPYYGFYNRSYGFQPRNGFHIYRR